MNKDIYILVLIRSLCSRWNTVRICQLLSEIVLSILSNLKQDIACGFGMETLSVLLKFHVVEMKLLFKVNEIGDKCGAATARSNLSWMNVLNMRSRISVCSQACLPSGCIIKRLLNARSCSSAICRLRFPLVCVS